MNRLWLLTKAIYKNSREGNVDGKKKARKILLTIIVLLSLIPILVGFVTFMNYSYDALHQINQEGILLGIGIAATCLVIFLFGIFQVINTFYFSKDVEYLLPLPLKPWEILGAKFLIVLIYEYITEAFFLIPIIALYGIKSSAGILYYLYGIIVFATLPLIPMILAALLSMVIMRFTNIGRHKETLKVIGGVITMALAIGFNMAMQFLGKSSESSKEVFQAIAEGNNSFVNIITRIFPTSKFAVQSMLKSSSISGVLFLLIFLGISIALFIAMLVLSQGIYFKGVVGVSETFSKRKKLSENEFAKSTAKIPSMKSYTFKELKLLFRTSVYFMNCVLMNFIWPVFFIPAMIQKDAMKDIKRLSTLFNSSGAGGKAIAFTMLFLVFILANNGVAVTSISREGSNIFVTKYLPISYRDQIMAKVYSQIVLNMGSLVIGIALLKVIIDIPVFVMGLIAVLGVLISFFSAMSGILIDLHYPKLHWDNEQKAVKQNYNVLISMLICCASGGLLTFIVVHFDVTLWPAFFIIAAVFAALDFILYNLICTKGVETFRKIEG